MPLSLANFDQQLAAALLKKGQDYYKKGAVRELEQNDKGVWQAFVDGTESYEVEVELNGQTITAHRCDCPVADPVCKHQVAVFYALRGEGSSSETTSEAPKKRGRKPTKSHTLAAEKAPKKPKDPFEEILSKLTDAELREFIRQYARKNKDIKANLTLRFADRLEGTGKAYYQKLLKEAARMHSDRHGFIDYRNARQYARHVDALLERATTLLGDQNYTGVYEIAQAVLEEVAKAIGQMDDSDGGAGGALEQALMLIEQVYRQSDSQELKNLVFDYLMKESQEDRYEGPGFGDVILDRLAVLCEYPDQEAAYEQLLNSLLAKARVKPESTARGIRFFYPPTSSLSDEWNWSEQKLLQRKIKLYLHRGRTAEARQLLESNIHLRSFREQLLDELIKEKEFARAKAIVNEKLTPEPHPATKGKANRNPGMSEWERLRQQSQWYGWLLKIAVAEQDTAAIREYALWLFRESGYAQLEYYRQFKNSHAVAERASVAADLISECEQNKNPVKAPFAGLGTAIFPHSLARLYVEEQQWEKLMVLVEKQGGLQEVLEFEKILKKHFPERLLQVYSKKVDRFAEINVDAGSYQLIAEVLQQMTQLPGGDELVAERLTDYRARYARRKRMMEELAKVKV
ncbi:SWIM zinc finger family protein [Nibrella viscosa]